MILFIYEGGDFQLIVGTPSWCVWVLQDIPEHGVLMWGLFVLHLQAVFANTHIYSDAKFKNQKLRGLFYGRVGWRGLKKAYIVHQCVPNEFLSYYDNVQFNTSSNHTDR